jgi:hypothetical protein
MRDLRRISNSDFKTEAKAARRDLERLRDEVRKRIHLAGMELRDQFEEIEREAEHLANRVEPVAAHALNQLAVRLRRLAHALDGNQ